jgi:hypothetical protein
MFTFVCNTTIWLNAIFGATNWHAYSSALHVSLQIRYIYYSCLCYILLG